MGEKTVHDGWNIATDARLQTGSAQKPISAYAPAFDQAENNGECTMAAQSGFGVALYKDAPIEVSEDASTLRTLGTTVPRWGMKGESCDQPPITLGEGCENVDVTLVPYASSAIRLTVLPQI